MDIQQVKETAAGHRVFLSLIAAALQVRTQYTKNALDIFQEELNKLYEPVRKDIQEDMEKKKPLTPSAIREWEMTKEKMFKRVHHKMVVKPMQTKNNEEEKVNRFLYNIMKDSTPDSATVLFTQCAMEFIKAKDPRDLLTVISLYNKGSFDEALKAVKTSNKENNEANLENNSNRVVILNADGTDSKA